MHIQLRQSVLLLRDINIYGICTTFHWRKTKQKKRKQVAPTVGLQ